MISEVTISETQPAIRPCPCSCCAEHRHAVAHGRDGVPCHCDAHPAHERCDCAFCAASAHAGIVQINTLVMQQLTGCPSCGSRLAIRTRLLRRGSPPAIVGCPSCGHVAHEAGADV